MAAKIRPFPTKAARARASALAEDLETRRRFVALPKPERTFT
jgi:hypothetical protein